MAAGCTPHAIHSFASAYSVMNSAGCARRVAFSRAPGSSGAAVARPSMARRSIVGAAPSSCAPMSPGYSTSRRSTPSRGRRISAQRSTVSRNTGSVSYSPRPIPG